MKAYSQQAAADALGISRGSVELYEAGQRRDGDRRSVEIPRTVELACAALWAGIQGHSDEGGASAQN